MAAPAVRQEVAEAVEVKDRAALRQQVEMEWVGPKAREPVEQQEVSRLRERPSAHPAPRAPTPGLRPTRTVLLVMGPLTAMTDPFA